MNIKWITLVWIFTTIILLGCFTPTKKVIIFSSFKEEKTNYTYERNKYSYGVLMSSYNTMRFLKGYSISEPIAPNFNYNSYTEMVNNNKNADLYLTSTYSINKGLLSYTINIHNNQGNIIWSYKLEKVLDNDNIEETLFEVADTISLKYSSILMNKEVGFSKISIEITGTNERLVDIHLNDQMVYSKVGNGFRGSIPVISGMDYNIKISDSDTKESLASGLVSIERENTKSLVIHNSKEVKILGADELIGRRLFFEVGSGSLGMISIGILYKFSREVIGEFAVGTSILPIDDTILTKFSTEVGGRYNFWSADIFSLSGLSKIYLSYYNNQISRSLGLAIGVGGEIGFAKLDIGLSTSFIGFQNVQIGPYWKLSIYF
ncbi:MAG: hypothetical protein RMJ37_05850 [Spirochaetia bacterium]|nr:hypothetical protein [Spirochaetota bacterium]MDW8112839.1 hypothetical protein [Spirochaetia bacterium]